MKRSHNAYEMVPIATRVIVGMSALGVLTVGCDHDPKPSVRGEIQGESSPHEQLDTASNPTAHDSPDPTPSGTAEAMPPATKAGPAKEREVRKFAKAYSAIRAVNAQYSPLITAAPNAEQARAAQRSANRATTMAMLEAGLNEDRYSEIAEAVQRDASMRQVFLDEIQRLESGEGQSQAAGKP